jgi:hypothetical protein
MSMNSKQGKGALGVPGGLEQRRSPLGFNLGGEWGTLRPIHISILFLSCLETEDC